MTGVIPPFYSGSPSAVANYNAVDIATGTGYILMYGGKTNAAHTLSNITYYTENHVTETTNNTDAYVKTVDLDFDALMNKPLTLRGKAIVNVPFQVSSAAFTGYAYVICKIRKYDGVTETDIATSAASTIINNSVTNPNYLVAACEIAVPATVIKKGEYLRLTVEGWCKNSNNGVLSAIKIPYDPKARTTYYNLGSWDTAQPTQLSAQIPTRIDL